MNQRLSKPFVWDDARTFDRGKVMTEEELEAGKTFGRYLDVDGDGIPYRTYPGTHAKRGAYFTRGTTKDRYARYSEEGPVYVDNMERLVKKFETAKTLVPQPVVRAAKRPAKNGVLYFGSTGPAMNEALDRLEESGQHLDAMRLRAFPFPAEVLEFIAKHEHVFVVEQNRDAQMRGMLINEGNIDPAKLVAVLHYDGTPITARFIARDIADKLARYNVTPIKKLAS